MSIQSFLLRNIFRKEFIGHFSDLCVLGVTYENDKKKVVELIYFQHGDPI